jgi:hypothetical protein
MAKVLLQNDESDVISSNLEIFSLFWLDANINNIKENGNNQQQLRNVINHLRSLKMKNHANNTLNKDQKRSD